MNCISISSDKQRTIYPTTLTTLIHLSGAVCPDQFYKIDNKCFYISKEKVTWIEARKHCEMKQSKLISLETEVLATKLSHHIETLSRRHFNEFWTSGNDIEVEGSWRWAGVTERELVPSFGWSEESFSSIEENCLVWVVEVVRGEVTAGWHPASCCNIHTFICSSQTL